MGRVADLTWASYKAEAKEYLWIDDTDWDTILERFWDAACRKADDYLCNPFEDIVPTLVFADVEADDTVTINDQVFTAAAATDADEREFKVGVDDDTDAEALQDLVNSNIMGGSEGAVGVDGVTATNTSGSITFTKRYPNETAAVVTSSNDTRLKVTNVRTQSDVPHTVVLWLFQFMAWKFANRDGRKSERVAAMGDIEWGDAPDMTLLALYRLSPGL